MWKAHALASRSRRLVYIQHGEIPYPVPDDLGENPLCIFPDGSEDAPYLWCECQWCGGLGLEFSGRTDRLACGCAEKHGVRKSFGDDTPRLRGAYEAARSARFEHGESGGR